MNIKLIIERFFKRFFSPPANDLKLLKYQKALETIANAPETDSFSFYGHPNRWIVWAKQEALKALNERNE